MGWPENTAFSSKLPTFQLAWDSTSLGALKKCARYYELAIVHGWQLKAGHRIDLDFGIWLHSGRERYYHARAAGGSHEAGVDAALQYVLTATWDRVLQRPWSGDQYKNRLSLARTLVDYLDKWEFDPLVTVILANSKPAVEVSFRFDLGFGPTSALPFDVEAEAGDTAQEQFSLCGHLDRVAEFQGRTWISDLKSTKSDLGERYWKQFIVNNQFSVYSLAGNVVLGSKIAGIIVDACQVLVTEPARFARRLVEKTEAQLSEFVRSLHVYLRQAEYYARQNFWPQNEPN